MGRLLWQNAYLATTGAGVSFIARVRNLGHCKVKLIGCLNDFETNFVTCQIQRIDAANTVSCPALSIFHRQEMVDVGIDVGWEGEIELQRDQMLVFTFERTVIAGVGTAPTAAHTVYFTVGYEAC